MKFEALDIGSVPAAEWESTLRGMPGLTPFHTYAWVDSVRRVYGHRGWLFTVRRDGECLAAVPGIEMHRPLRRPVMVSMPYASYGGPINKDRSALSILLARLRRACGLHSWAYVELRHRGWPPLDVPGPWPTHAGFELDLAVPSPDDLWSRIGRTWRKNVRHAQRDTRIDFGPSHLDAFYRVYAEGMRELGTPCHSHAWFEALLRSFGASATVVVAYRGEEPVAGSFLLEHRPTVYHTWGAIRRSRAEDANFGVVWAIMEHYHRAGFRVLDFGRSPLGSGTEAFKKGWGATSVPLQFAYVSMRPVVWPSRDPKGTRRKVLSAVWRHVPEGLAFRIGPRLRAHIP